MILEESMLPFDLSNGPLLRTRICRVDDKKWVLIYVMHHIIGDAWSMGILIRELLPLYNADRNAARPQPPLPIQYKDYADWQQQQLAGEALNEHRDYWLKQLQGELPVLELTDNKARPAIKTYNGRTLRRKISQGTCQKIRAISHRQGATLFMGLLATVNALLYRYTGQEDIILGSPIAGRDHPDTECQLGLYANTLPLRIRLSGEDNFEEL